VLVFTRTKHIANRLAERLEREGIQAAAIHGNKSQGARTKALAGFKSGEVRVLVATDIAARGLDIDKLPQVVNFELPNVAEDYVHRIGRTGRAGSAGHAISLVSADEGKLLRGIERLIKQELPREIVAGFEPDAQTMRAIEQALGNRCARVKSRMVAQPALEVVVRAKGRGVVPVNPAMAKRVGMAKQPLAAIAVASRLRMAAVAPRNEPRIATPIRRSSLTATSDLSHA
jgi:superfamily II DNA/RNA helicase